MKTLTEHTVTIEDVQVPVTQDIRGRLHAIKDNRHWHAMTLDILNERINRTFTIPPHILLKGQP